MMKIDPHAYAENFISEDEFQIRARNRGIEVGANDATTYLRNQLLKLAPDLASEVSGF